MRSLFLIAGLTLGCAEKPPPPVPSCVLTDRLAEQLEDADYAAARMFGASAYESRGCTAAELGTAGVDLSALGLELGPARLDFLQITTPDGSELYVHATGLAPDFDLDANTRLLLDTKPLAGTTEGTELRASAYTPPPSWPIRDGAPAAGRITRPDWWTVAPDTPGALVASQEPIAFARCQNPRGQGRLIFASGRELWVHSWSLQHFFPDGACGG